ncbi:hypothetical protein P3X46_006024 [Hevea brasiliensis]|uniref:Pentatricopeptide repeat-containing protein n=1 Tax=Hevea brasiliensis TaxID=3981 RepID=A0ABQ9MNW3_HEVBR|nr:hypothetical protein P3X46_006024 [Hevea brasiliensis]
MLTSYSQLGLHLSLSLSLSHTHTHTHTVSFLSNENQQQQTDHFTSTATVSAYAGSGSILNGTKMHALVTVSGYQSSLAVNNSFIDNYGKCLNAFSADDVLKEMDDANEVAWCSLLFAKVNIAWNTTIVALGRYGENEICLDMRQSLCEPDQWTFQCPYKLQVLALNHQSFYASMCCIVSLLRVILPCWQGGNHLLPYDFMFAAVLHACSNLAVLGIHAYIGNGFVNMYTNCRDLDGSILAFADICEKDLVSFNAMLFAFGWHKKASQVLQLTMGHAFWLCLDEVAIGEAKELANKHSKTSHIESNSCEDLLGACFAHSEVEIGTCFGEALKVLEPYKELSYVLQSNLCYAGVQWKEAVMVRKAMVDEGLKKKMPGCGWIEVRNKVTSFAAGTIYNRTWKSHVRYYTSWSLK